MSEIITEYLNENTKDIDIISTVEMIKKINDEDKLVAYAVESEIEHIAQAVDLIAESFNNGGNLIYFGCGTSGRLGILDASECPPTFSTNPEMVQGIIAGGKDAFTRAVEGAEDDFEQGVEDAKILAPEDICVVISASGNPKYLLGVLKTADEIGAKTIAITCNSESKIGEEVRVCICAEVGPEVIAGSSRLKAGTAQKMILNMLSTGSMIKIGKTYKNLMIDLRATNDKLKDRAIRIVSQIAETTHAKAFAVLEKSDWDIKIAVASILLNLDIDEAKKELKKHGGVLRKLLKSGEKI